MYFKEWIIFIIVVSWVVDRYFAYREETGNMVFKFLKKNPLLLTALLIFGLIYLLDILGGHFIWLALLLGLFFMMAMLSSSDKKPLRKAQHFFGFVFITLCFINVLLYTRYELQTKFYQPCWSPDGKQIAFFMEKDLIQYRFGIIGGWSPNPLLHKYYLCTMDYDGKNFKQIKQTDPGYDNVSWSGNSNIIYSFNNELRKINIDKLQEDVILQENTYSWILNPWLSNDGRYVGYILHSREPGVETGVRYKDDLKVKNIKDNKELVNIQIENKISQHNYFYGAYSKNMIIYCEKEICSLFDLTAGTKKVYKNGDSYLTELLSEFDIREKSPDRSMSAETGAINEWHVDAILIKNSNNNKILGKITYKTKRSNLFNIFGK